MVKVDRTYLTFDARIEDALSIRDTPIGVLGYMTATARYYVLLRAGFSKDDCAIVEMYLCEKGHEHLPETYSVDESNRVTMLSRAQALIESSSTMDTDDDYDSAPSRLTQFVSSKIIEEEKAANVDDEEDTLFFDNKSSYDYKYERRSSLSDNYVGLVNGGSTCYLNSTVQVLFNIPFFRKLIYSINVSTIEGSDASRAIVTALQSLFFSMQRKESGVRTTQLTEAFGWSQGQLSVQHDVHEMIQKLLEGLEVITSGTDIDTQVKSTFFGEMLRFVNCLDVRHVSPTYTPFLDLELIVKDCTTIYDSLVELTKIEQLDCKYAWDHEDGTTTRHPAELGAIISRPPSILIIHPLRLSFCMETLGPITVENEWSFPCNLNISRFCRGNPDDADDVSVANPDGADRDADYPAFDYAIQAVVVHVGSAHAGHYYCYQKVGDEWLQFNDTVVSVVSETKVFEEAFAKPTWYTDYWGTKQTRAATHRATLLTYVRKEDLGHIVFPLEDSSLPAHLIENMVAYEQKRKEIEEEKTRKERMITIRVLLEDASGTFLEAISEAEHKDMPRVEIDKYANVDEIEAAISKALDLPPNTIKELWMYESKGVTYRSDYYSAFNLRTKVPTPYYLEKGTIFVQVYPSHHRPKSGNGKRERDEDESDLLRVRADTDTFPTSKDVEDSSFPSSQLAEEPSPNSILSGIAVPPEPASAMRSAQVFHFCFLQSADHSIQYVSTVNSVSEIEAYLATHHEAQVLAELRSIATTKAAAKAAEQKEVPPAVSEEEPREKLGDAFELEKLTPTATTTSEFDTDEGKDSGTPPTDFLEVLAVENKASTVVEEEEEKPKLWNYFINRKKTLDFINTLYLYSGEIVVVAPSYVSLKDANRANDRVSNAISVTVSQLDDVEDGEELFEVILYPRLSYAEVQQVIFDALTSSSTCFENPLRVMPKSAEHIGLRTHDLDSDLPHMNMCNTYKYKSVYAAAQDAEGILTSRNILIRKVYMSVLPDTILNLEKNDFKEIPVRISHYFCRIVYVPTSYDFLATNKMRDALFMVYEQLEPFMAPSLAAQILSRLHATRSRLENGEKVLDNVFRLIRLKYNSNEIENCFLEWNSRLSAYFQHSSSTRFAIDLLPFDCAEGVLPEQANNILQELQATCETDEQLAELVLPPQWMDAFHIDRRSGRGEVYGYPFSVVIREIEHKTGKQLLREVIAQIGIFPDEDVAAAETSSAASTGAITPTSAQTPSGSHISNFPAELSVYADAMKNWRLVFNGVVGVKVLDREAKFSDIQGGVGRLISVMLDHPQVSRGVQKGASRRHRAQESIKINVITDQVKPISATMTTSSGALKAEN